MYFVLIALIVVDTAFLAVSSFQGVLLDDPGSMRQHMTWGVVTTCLLLFTHCLVLFYLIGTESDVKEALEDRPDLAPEYVAWAKSLKRRAFPWGSLAALATVLAALLGGHVHSNLLIEAPPDEPPLLRGVPGWWAHLVLVVFALVTNGRAFAVELGVVRENRRGIGELNALLEAENAPPAVPSET